MKILLISGGIHRIVTEYAGKNVDIINNKELELKDLHSIFHDGNPSFEGILVTEEAFSQQVEKDKQDLSLLFQLLDKTEVKVLVLTRDFLKETEFSDLLKKHYNLSIMVYDFIRAPGNVYKHAFEELLIGKKPINEQVDKREKTVVAEKKKSFLDRFRSKPKNEPELQITDRLTRELENVSRGISRIVALTGHRGCGLTSTVVNVAYEASKRGLSVIIIDMDIDYRSTNMYFSNFHERTKNDEDMNAALIRTLARPQDYMTTAFNIKDKLWLASLGYGFTDRKLIDQFYNNSKFIGLLSVLRSKFNLVILDMPIDLFKVLKETLIHIDVFGLCVPNNLYSIISTLRNIEVALGRENASYINAKSKVVVTKYNDRSIFQNDMFTPDKVSEVLSSGLYEGFPFEMKVAGYVPYSNEFDAQIETDVPLVNISAHHEMAYGSILLRLMEGAK